jgi:Glycosyl transferase family 2/Methyltransferase domain
MSATLPPADLVSVIVPLCGNPAQTRLCLDALLEHTRPSWEVIVIDDNSADGTVDHVLSLRRTGAPVTLIANHVSRGFGAACNQGLRSARGGYIAVVPSDTIVTKGWADQLIALLKTDPEMAVAGPMSNDAPPPQRVEGTSYTDRSTLQRFATHWRTANRGRWFDVERLCGSCLLAKRGVLDVAGGFDESIAAGFVFDDLCLKIRHAGGRMAVAQDLYIHHFVSPWLQAWTQVARTWDQIPGMFDFESVYDAAVNVAKDGAVFVEVGCMAGRSTCYLGNQIRGSGKAILLHAIDAATGSPADETGQPIISSLGGSMAGILHRNILGCGLEQVVVPILTSSVRASVLFPNEGIDFCFIDGQHNYESATADLNAWWPKVRPGGMLAGHGYRGQEPGTIGITPAVHDFFGVTDATHPEAAYCWAMVKPMGSRANGAADRRANVFVDGSSV